MCSFLQSAGTFSLLGPILPSNVFTNTISVFLPEERDHVYQLTTASFQAIASHSFCDLPISFGVVETVSLKSKKCSVCTNPRAVG